MEIFYALCAAAVIIIGIVIFMMIKDEKESGETVQKLSADSLDNPFADKPKKSFKAKKSINLKASLGGILGKFKKPKKDTLPTPGSDPFNTPPAAFNKQPAKKTSLLSKLKFGKKNKGDMSSNSTTITAKGSSSLFGKLLGKLKKNKGQDDLHHIPEPTPFPNLNQGNEKDSNTIPIITSDNNFNNAAGGSAHLAINETQKPSDEPVEPLIGIGDEEKVEAEIEAQMQLTELKEKYEKLEQLFREKSEELEKTDHTLQNEVHNRKEFNKVKDVLEKELKDVKLRAKDMQNKLSEADVSDKEHQNNISELEDRALNLEKIVQEKETEIEELVQKAQAKEDSTAQDEPGEEPSDPMPPSPEASPKESEAPKSDTSNAPEQSIEKLEPKPEPAITLEPEQSSDITETSAKSHPSTPPAEEDNISAEELGKVKIEAISPQEAKKEYDPSDIERELGIGAEEAAPEKAPPPASEKSDTPNEASTPPVTEESQKSEVESAPVEEPKKTEEQPAPEAAEATPADKPTPLESTPDIELTSQNDEELKPETESDFLSLNPDVAETANPLDDVPPAANEDQKNLSSSPKDEDAPEKNTEKKE